MANDYFFFTDINQQASNATDYIKVQTSGGAYGPIPPAPTGHTTDEYRVTSLHTASYNPTAYAACEGIVCVQRIPVTTPPLVNVILKPLVQPALNSAPIKYIIYKGILESSLVNGLETAAAANNRLTQFVWDEQAKKNKSAGTTAKPPAEALGVGLTAATPPIPNDPINDPYHDDQPIDNLFCRTGVSFQLPKVNGGWSIGQFYKDDFGIEVLMEGLAFHHPLSFARQRENKISVTALTGIESPSQIFDHWHAKEQVLGFMDPCAFYGSFFLAGVQAKNSSDAKFALKAGSMLYHDLLFAFDNKKVAYLDIRNEHNFSINYFGNYVGTPTARGLIKLSYNPAIATDPAPIDYYASKWPIMTLTGFPAGNTTKERNAFRIQLPVGDNADPLLYVSQGYRDINSKGDGFPSELKSADRFYDAFKAPVGGFTATKNKSGLNSMAFVVPNAKDAATPVSCYIRLKYLKQQTQDATTVPVVPTVIRSSNYLDNLIYPLDLSLIFNGVAKIKTSVYDEEIYVNALDVAGLKFDFMGKVGIARDSDNTSFFLLPTTMRTQTGPASALVSLIGETSGYLGSYPNLVALKYALESVRKSELFLETDKIPIAEFVSGADTAEQAKFMVPDFEKFFIVVVANAAYDAWKTKVAALDDRFRVYLGVKKLQTLTDSKLVKYTFFELVLRGFALNATTGTYEVREINTDPDDSVNNIKVYAHASN